MAVSGDVGEEFPDEDWAEKAAKRLAARLKHILDS